MEKYKICPNPNCGKHNKSKAIECAWCETDLSGVKPTDDETEAARIQEENNKIGDSVNEEGINRPPSSGKLIRICEFCGTHNSANARKCSSCGEDISDVTPTSENTDSTTTQNENQSRYVLTSLDGIFSFEVPEGRTLIGREERLNEFLANKLYVSRRHAEVIFLDGSLSIINISNTNFTYVNNKKITDHNPVILHDGDEIGLGGNLTYGERQEQAAYFRVKVD